MSYSQKIADRKFGNKNGSDADDFDVLGDADTTSTVTSALSEMLKAGGAVAADAQAKKEAADKAAAAQAAATASSAEQMSAVAAATQARKTATFMAADAITETDPNGPKHKAAAAADLQAKAAEAKAAFYGPLPPGQGGPLVPVGKKSSIFTPMHLAIGLGGLAAVFIGYKLLKRPS